MPLMTKMLKTKIVNKESWMNKLVINSYYPYALMAELVDAADLKSVDRKVVRVRSPLGA